MHNIAQHYTMCTSRCDASGLGLEVVKALARPLVRLIYIYIVAYIIRTIYYITLYYIVSGLGLEVVKALARPLVQLINT